jgi:hypothetical protein
LMKPAGVPEANSDRKQRISINRWKAGQFSPRGRHKKRRSH